jgi:hypothetical protein
VGAKNVPIHEADYGWMEGAEVRNSPDLKQQPVAESRSWWGYDTFDGDSLNAPFVSVWAEYNGALWNIYATELDPDGDRRTHTDLAWGAGLFSLTSTTDDQSEATGTEIFTVSYERFGTYIVWTEGGATRAAHLNYFDMFERFRVNEAVGPGPDLFSPGPVSNLQASPQAGWVDLTWTNPDVVNADKPFDDFKGVLIVRTTDGPALSPYDFPEEAWREAGATMFYSDASVEVGVTYYYTAFAYDTEFAQLNFSTPVWTSIRVGFGDVENFQALGAGIDKIELSWTNPNSVDFAGVEIWRDTAGYPAGPVTIGTEEKVGLVLVTNPVPNRLTDTGLVTPQPVKYFYAAFPLDDPDGTPYTTLGARAVAATVGGVTGFAATGEDAAVDLTWENPTVDPTPGTYDGVVICRVNGSTVPASPTDGPLTVDPILNLIGEPGSHFDGDVTNTTEYSYAVYAAYTFDGDRVYAVPGTGTTTPVDLSAPDPITNFTASIPAAYTIYNSWTPPDLTLPANSDLLGLLILRKVGSYPTSPTDLDSVVVLNEKLETPGVGPLSNDGYDVGGEEALLDVDLVYYYAAWTYDDQPVPNFSVVALATPPLSPLANLPPEIILGPTSAPTHDSATIDWTARDRDGDTITGVVRWGLDATALVPGHVIMWTTSSSITCPDSEPTDFVISGLKSGATYVFEVTVTDSTGQTVTAQGVPFTTDAPLADEGDGLPDAWELLYDTDTSNPLDKDAIDSGSSSLDDDEEDFDDDGLTNMAEYFFGTDPHDADTDGDGIADGVEVLNGKSPLEGVTGGPLDGNGGCGSGGHAPLAWVLLFAAAMLPLRRRKLATQVI